MIWVTTFAMHDLVTGTASSTNEADDAPAVDAAEEARLIVALDGRNPRAPGARVMLGEIDRAALGRGDERRVLRDGRGMRIMLADRSLSREHLRLRRQASGWELEDASSKNGTVVNGVATRRTLLADGDIIEAGAAVLVYREATGRESLGRLGDRDLATEDGVPVAFRTLAPDLEWRFRELARLARSTIPILIGGPTGSGKELVARAIHDESRRPGAFISVNCGALPRGLVESELFGHRRGAFTGAGDDRAGLVRRAHRGTLFLDEIAELPDDTQAALLRVLQDGEVRPLGGDVTHVDVRVVAATHQDLHRRIAEGRFRRDLYARLAGASTALPPLSDRREDIGTIVATMLPRFAIAPERVSFQKAAARALMRYPFPLNIRELEHALRSALVLSDGDEIRLEHLPEPIKTWTPRPSSQLEDRAFRDRLIEILRESRGNVAAAARVLNRYPVQVRRWCRRFEIDLADFRD